MPPREPTGEINAAPATANNNAGHCTSAAAGMLRFLARLSGRRRHVRRGSGPGATTTQATSGTEEETSASAAAAAASLILCAAASLEAEEKTTATPKDSRICGELQHESPECLCHEYERLPRTEPHPREDPHLDQRHHHHLHHHHHHHSRSHASHRIECLEETRHSQKESSAQRKAQVEALLGSGHDDEQGLVGNSNTTVTAMIRRCKIPPYLATLLLLSCTFFGIADACSSRSTPRPRPPTPSPRPNVTFHMYTCPPNYAEWYCLNGATCFTVKIVDSFLYNCLCANGYIGQRCEFKDLDGSYLPSRQRVMLETASIAGGATIAVFLVVIICIAAYIHCKRKQKELRTSNCVDTVDGPARDPEPRPFTNRSRSLMIFMAKNSNSLAIVSPTIEHTRMIGWTYSQPESTTRMTSINESKRLSQ